MDENTKRALKDMARHFKMFARNGRWGTCVDCPADSEDNQYPEFCPNTKRYDHHLNIDELAETYKIYTRPKQ